MSQSMLSLTFLFIASNKSKACISIHYKLIELHIMKSIKKWPKLQFGFEQFKTIFLFLFDKTLVS